MQLLSWLRKRMAGRPHTRRTPAERPAPRFRPRLEALEARDVPSLLTVDDVNLGLGAAIDAAASGDTINFASSLDGQTLDVGGQLIITKNLTIQGPGAGLLALSGADGSAIVNPRIFQVASGVTVTLSGLTLENGGGTATGYFPNSSGEPSAWDQYGGAILNFGTLTVSACTLSGNSAGSLDDATGYVAFGGAIYNAGTLTVNNSTLSDNSVFYSQSVLPPPGYAGRGGAIYNAGSATLNGTNVTGNNALFQGGGLYNAGALTLNGGTVSSNWGPFQGGGIFNDGTATLGGTLISNNSAGQGGGIYNDNSMTLNSSTVSSNFATSAGGGIDNEGNLILEFSTVTGNSVAKHGSGADLFNAGTFTNDGSTIGGRRGK
jgi:hypothetical protein